MAHGYDWGALEALGADLALALGLQLGKPATRADVIGWSMTVPLVTWLVVLMPEMARLPGRYEDILEPFDRPWPPATELVFNVGGGGLVVLYVLMALAPLAVLFFSTRPWPKVLVPVAIGALAVGVNAFVVEALFAPMASIAAQFPMK